MERPSDATDDDRQEVIEFEVVGTLTRAFLRRSVQISGRQHQIFHSDSSQFQERGYCWPSEGTDAKFTSKDNWEEAYEEIWDIHDIDLHEMDSRAPLTVDDSEEGSKIFVEYTISPYSARKSRPNVERFEAGTTLQLLSVRLLERSDRKLDFESPRKKRRMAA